MQESDAKRHFSLFFAFFSESFTNEYMHFSSPTSVEKTQKKVLATRQKKSGKSYPPNDREAIISAGTLRYLFKAFGGTFGGTFG